VRGDFAEDVAGDDAHALDSAGLSVSRCDLLHELHG
jgi:hypothetical protein